MKVRVKNTSGVIAFFTQLQLTDELGTPVRPAFFTDNFFSLLPGETREVVVDTKKTDGTQYRIVVKGWNQSRQDILVK